MVLHSKDPAFTLAFKILGDWFLLTALASSTCTSLNMSCITPLGQLTTQSSRFSSPPPVSLS
jgi:hypothetical protein